VAQLSREHLIWKRKNKDRQSGAKGRDLKKVAEYKALAQDLSEASKKVETLRPEKSNPRKSTKSPIEKQIKELEQSNPKR